MQRLKTFNDLARGISVGISVALLGSIIYSIDQFVETGIDNSWNYAISAIKYEFTTFWLVFMATIIPASIAGAYLAHSITKDIDNDIFSIKRSKLKGAIIGVLAGATLSCFAIFNTMGGRIELSFLLVESLKGIALSTLGGYSAGWLLAKTKKIKTE